MTLSYISDKTSHGMMQANTPDHSVWLYGVMPQAEPLIGSVPDSARVAHNDQLLTIYEQLADTHRSALQTRQTAKGGYREFHILASCLPTHIMPEDGSALSEWIKHAYSSRYVDRRATYFGVRLRPQTRRDIRLTPGQDRLKRFENFWSNLTTASAYFASYDSDRLFVSQAMTASGIIPFDTLPDDELHHHVETLRSWFQNATSDDTCVVPDYDHLHLCITRQAARRVQQLVDAHIDCTTHPVPGVLPVTVWRLKDTTYTQTPVIRESTLWAAQLMSATRTSGLALGVSMRGLIEPAAITLDTVKRMHTLVAETIDEKMKHNESVPANLDEYRDLLAEKETYFRRGTNLRVVPPTITDLNVTVLTLGRPDDAIRELGRIPGVAFSNYKDAGYLMHGFQSMLPCSPVSVHSFKIDVSSTFATGAGFEHLSTGGDPHGALLGVSEDSKQPVYVDPMALRLARRTPCWAVVGSSGSNKTFTLLSLSLQFNMMRHPQTGMSIPSVFIEPKRTSGHEDEDMGFIRLDSDKYYGALDPIVFSHDKQQGIELAASMVTSIVGDHSRDFQLLVVQMLQYGHTAGKQTTTGCLEYAAQAYQSGEDGLPAQTGLVWEKIRVAIESSDLSKYMFSTTDHPQLLHTDGQMTVIMAGERDLLPVEGGGEDDIVNTLRRWLLRMLIMAAGETLRGTDGVVVFDEASAVLGGDGKESISRMIRVIRSQGYSLMLASQRADDFAGVKDSIERALVLPLHEDQAQTAVELLGIPDAQNIARRIGRPAVLPNGEPNYRSTALVLDVHGNTTRGVVPLFFDRGRAPIFVESVVPPEQVKHIQRIQKSMGEEI